MKNHNDSELSTQAIDALIAELAKNIDFIATEYANNMIVMAHDRGELLQGLSNHVKGQGAILDEDAIFSTLKKWVTDKLTQETEAAIKAGLEKNAKKTRGSKRPEELVSIFPPIFSEPTEKIGKMLFNNEIALEHVRPIITAKDDYGALVKRTLSETPQGVTAIKRELNATSEAVQNAIGTLWDAGNKVAWVKDINRLVTKNPKARLTHKQYDAIVSSVNLLRQEGLTIISSGEVEPTAWAKTKIKPEKTVYKKVSDRVSSPLVKIGDTYTRAITTKVADEQGNVSKETREVVTGWEILQAPILYDRGKTLGQMASTPLELMQPNQEKSEHNYSRTSAASIISSKLAREIDTMYKCKDRKHTYPTTISCERLYKWGGIENTENRTLTARIRKEVEKILGLMLQNGADKFKSFRWVKKTIGKSKKITGLEIILTSSKAAKNKA